MTFTIVREFLTVVFFCAILYETGASKTSRLDGGILKVLSSRDCSGSFYSKNYHFYFLVDIKEGKSVKSLFTFVKWVEVFLIPGAMV
ncbi:hypothetical protein SANA_00240 [Gottschalkiaceae bacterium SANA]|nr:hypothetical protein SANA_00240 [Gottschalkiaceae bacterium SANA]